MDPNAIAPYLENQRALILSTTKKDGAPVAHALWFVYCNGVVYFNIQAKSFKYKNIQRDNRVCCLVESGERYLDLKGVMIQGRCTPVTDPAEVERYEQARQEKNRRIGDGMDGMPEWFHGNRQQRLNRGDRVLLKVPLEKVTTWDFSKVADYYKAKPGSKPPQ
jgi:hypothetical protein